MSDATRVTPWRTAEEGAARAQVLIKQIYRAIDLGKLRAARVGGKRAIRLRDEWVDAWLEAAAPQESAS